MASNTVYSFVAWLSCVLLAIVDRPHATADLNRIAVESIDFATDGERDGLADAGANCVLDRGRIGDVADHRALGGLLQQFRE